MGHLEKRILTLGAGNYGTCLSNHLANRGYSVTVWTRNKSVADGINKDQRNPKYLSHAALSPRLSAHTELNEEIIDSASCIILATPTQSLREVLAQLKGKIAPDTVLLCAAKGIEIGSLLLPLDIIKEVLGDDIATDAVILSGPSFAAEVIARQPTAVAAASINPQSANRIQTAFHTAHFRVYSGADPIGLEVAGALKNVIAIAAGAAKGIGYQANSSAALLTRGLAELMRIGVALGAKPLTFNGLGGVGDLFLTCTSEKSRNFTVGYRLGKGESLTHIIDTVGSVAEGVTTTKAAHQLVTKLQIECPIIEQVYAVLYENKPIVQAVTDLLTREAKPEIDLPRFQP